MVKWNQSNIHVERHVADVLATVGQEGDLLVRLHPLGPQHLEEARALLGGVDVAAVQADGQLQVRPRQFIPVAPTAEAPPTALFPTLEKRPRRARSSPRPDTHERFSPPGSMSSMSSVSMNSLNGESLDSSTSARRSPEVA